MQEISKEGVETMRIRGLGAGVIGAALTAGALLTGGVTTDTPAHADQTTYLNDVRGAAPTPNRLDPTLLREGRAVCAWIKEGATPEKLERLARQDLAQEDGCFLVCRDTPVQAATIVEYARVDLCPGG
jgi:hypothetical protein